MFGWFKETLGTSRDGELHDPSQTRTPRTSLGTYLWDTTGFEFHVNLADKHPHCDILPSYADFCGELVSDDNRRLDNDAWKKFEARGKVRDDAESASIASFEVGSGRKLGSRRSLLQEPGNDDIYNGWSLAVADATGRYGDSCSANGGLANARPTGTLSSGASHASPSGLYLV